MEEPIDTTMSAIHYLALGDSYTIGEAVSPAQRFPNQLADRLRADSFTVSEVSIIARTGWTTNELQAAIQAENPSTERYNLVTLLIGVNNQFRGRSLSNYREEFRELLLQAIELSGDRPERVFVLSIPDYGVTPFGQSTGQAERIGRQIDEFNAAARAITENEGITFINITPISRQAAADPELIADDDLHPSGKMYAAWVELLLPFVKTAID